MKRRRTSVNIRRQSSERPRKLQKITSSRAVQNGNLQEVFLQALENNNLQEAQSLFPFIKPSFIKRLIEYGARNVVVGLLALGVDINNGFLNTAIANEDVELAEYLIKAGADINREHVGLTPLDWALWETPSQEMIKLLVEAGVELQEDDIDHVIEVFGKNSKIFNFIESMLC